MVALRQGAVGGRSVKPLVDFPAARALDVRASAEIGVPEAALMETAALGMAEAILFSLPGECGAIKIVALCGSGNNAGDAIAVARILSCRRPATVSVLVGSSRPRGLAAAQLDAIARLGAAVLDWNVDRQASEAAVSGADLLLDGLAGVGLDGALAGSSAEIARTVNAVRTARGGRTPRVCAIDLPSGLSDGTSGETPGDILRADSTLCVEPLKSALYRPAFRPACGEIIPIPHVFPAPLANEVSVSRYLVDVDDLSGFIDRVPDDAHKYRAGSVAVFAGDVGSTGAAVLAATGAESVAGLVTLFCRDPIWNACAARLDGTMAKPENSFRDFARFGAILLGSGWGFDASREALFASAWDSGLPLVLDADGLRLLKRLAPGSRHAPLVLTPHLGELAALADAPQAEVDADAYGYALAIARGYGAVVVAKSHVTWIVEPDGRAFVYDGMTPELAIGGSGDVLAGTLAAFLSRGGDATRAALAAVLAHGEAGRCLAAREGRFSAKRLARETGRVAAMAARRTP